MRCEAQDGPSFRPARVGTTCSSATQAACNEAARPNPTGEIGDLISCHILRPGWAVPGLWIRLIACAGRQLKGGTRYCIMG